MTGHPTRPNIALSHDPEQLDRTIHDIAAGRATARQCAETASALRHLSHELSDHAAVLAFGGPPPSEQPPTTGTTPEEPRKREDSE
ncbi:hypothetical protein SAMN04487904_104193 [Actinopolyspora lacussalsi subsp. righensis]|uniref:Uncharacterized protein n=1 Tax=Actinopolyspora righensis TaxID=995060 RepID=A0A1I6ZBT7_9ACTN|nr:hypothetical protein [Actinopolyspora righensis]SFT60182.1 hypothetical protein SAMN04487904_104193 [Actinopolyspora righensis]